MLYDDQQDEEMSLEKEVFRWLGPKGITAGYTTSMHEIMAVRGATNVCRIRSSPTIETARTDLAALSRPKEAVGRRLFIYWEATGEKIEAEVLSYDHRRKLHYVWYRDGELEWVDLKRERFAWIDDKNNNRLVREFPAGLDEGSVVGSFGFFKTYTHHRRDNTSRESGRWLASCGVLERRRSVL